jgi:membrane-bound metal-dependent hydrolase YbcI (DUF457 family)
MYPMGHMALGYLAARATRGITKYDFNLLLLWFISVSPDIDFLIPFVIHRGPTHSLAVILVFLVPILLFRREWLPYVAGLGSHALIGDLITGANSVPGSMLFWPISSSFVGSGVYLRMGSAFEVGLELILFALMIIMLKYSDEIRDL